MMATKEEFVVAFEQIGGKKELKPRLLEWIRHRLARNAEVLSIFDATAIDVMDEELGQIETRLVQRMYVPTTSTEAAHVALSELGVQSHERYVQHSDDGMQQWVQFTPTGDEEFVRYAAIRCLLDGAPKEGGIVEISPEDLSLAANGQLYYAEDI